METPLGFEAQTKAKMTPTFPRRHFVFRRPFRTKAPIWFSRRPDMSASAGDKDTRHRPCTLCGAIPAKGLQTRKRTVVSMNSITSTPTNLTTKFFGMKFYDQGPDKAPETNFNVLKENPVAAATHLPK